MQPLPATVLHYMFPPGRQLPQLQELALWSLDGECTAAGTVSAAELRSIINACPALCELNIAGIVKAGADVALLLQLPGTCCSLVVGGAAFGDSAAGVISQLTQLTELYWPFTDYLEDGGLQLTALKQLQSLEFVTTNTRWATWRTRRRGRLTWRRVNRCGLLTVARLGAFWWRAYSAPTLCLVALYLIMLLCCTCCSPAACLAAAA